ncbi:transposase family protein [Streptomyces sp. NBC_00452]|uniref:helix-turn-helix domain-containing protein n=1 Tax=Streptomyces sp. NBC_00452 TaxID=2975746 RepID=UPI00225A0836|nr:transposase family protein [Streptomyces sp. NBC_00452]MCX5058991.1 transposase family protein [Streptomyces sp. NBC_00452]
MGNATRAVIISNRRITGLTAGVIAELVGEIGPLWHERHQAWLASRPRKRALGAGAKHRLVFVDRLLATLVHLRHGVTHDMLACWFGADRSTITRAVNEVRPLLAERGCTVTPDVRLRSLAEVINHRYEEMYERQRKAHSSRRIRVEHGIAHLKNWRALARHLGRREHMSDTVQAIAGRLSHQQTVDLSSTRQM